MCSDEIKEKLLSECDKLSKMQGTSVDASIIRSYLDTALSLNFGNYTIDAKATITASTNLSDEEIERMRKEAKTE